MTMTVTISRANVRSFTAFEFYRYNPLNPMAWHRRTSPSSRVGVRRRGDRSGLSGGGDRACDGARAAMQMWVREALARRRPELGELAASHRLVHLLAHHPRHGLLLSAVARGETAVSRRAVRAGGAAGSVVGGVREHAAGDQPLSRRDNLARL